MEVCPKWWSFELRNCIVGSSFQTLDISRQRMLYYPIGYIPAGECILYTVYMCCISYRMRLQSWCLAVSSLIFSGEVYSHKSSVAVVTTPVQVAGWNHGPGRLDCCLEHIIQSSDATNDYWVPSKTGVPRFHKLQNDGNRLGEMVQLTTKPKLLLLD